SYGQAPPRQRLDPKRRRHFVHLLDQRRRERHAILLSVGAALEAALPWNPDLVDAGEPLRAFKIVHMAVDLGLEDVERQEALGVERDHEVAGVGLALLLGGGVAHVAPERGAVERAAEKPEHDRKARALIGADRNEKALGK